jgi:hypothetical protein
VITLVNIFTVDPAKQQQLLDILVRTTVEFVSRTPGFISSTLDRSLDGSKATMYAHWRSIEDYQAMRRDPGPLSLFKEALALAKFESGMYETCRTSHLTAASSGIC